MEWSEFLKWLVPAILISIGVIVWRKLDSLDGKVDLLMQTELRYIDVRISVIEKHLGLERPSK